MWLFESLQSAHVFLDREVPLSQIRVSEKLADELFALDPHVRYVASNQARRLVLMKQNPRWPSYNDDETDRMEELVVNPVVVELTRRRGELDLGGMQYVAIRYGVQYQLVVPFGEGHVSVGVEHEADIAGVASKVLEHLGSAS